MPVIRLQRKKFGGLLWHSYNQEIIRRYVCNARIDPGVLIANLERPIF